MVTFRFYLVSIVAFFLALAVGVVVGSVLDQGISNSLQDRLDGVERNLDDTVASIDDKNREIDALQSYAEASAPFAVDSTLDGTSALVVAEPGLDKAPVEDLVLRLRQSGSHVSGIVWLDPRWDLTTAEDRAQFGGIVGGTGLSVAQLHRSAWDEVLSGTAPTPTDPSTTTTTTTTVSGSSTTTPEQTTVPPGTAVALFDDPVLTQLQDAGFLRLVSVDGDDPTGGSELVVATVTGPGSTLATPGAAAIELATQSSELAVPTVVSEVYLDDSAAGEKAADRGPIVRAATDGATVKFSTIDDLDLVAGRVASVLALDAFRGGVIGRFGYGPDVDGILPRWPVP